MSEANKVYELFESQKEFYEKVTAEGIEKYRKGNGKITLKDKNGVALKNAKIKIKQKSHEFRFGANLFMLDEFESEEKNEKYKSCFSKLFNMATLPFYWRDLEPEKGKQRYGKDSPKIYRRPSPDLCIEFCEQNGIEPREHALAYEQWFPLWLKGESDQVVKGELERRFAEIAERYAHKIPTIEVTNEMIGWEKGITDFFENPDYIPYCFKLAEKYFPNNELCINEATPYAWTDRCRTSCAYYAYTEAAMLKGARVDAIGMQFHIFNEQYSKDYFKLLDLENLYDHMNLFAKFGKPLEITEVTIPSYSWQPDDEELQADIIEKLYSLWFSHPSTSQIVYWNIIDGYAHLWSHDREKIKASQGNMARGSENYYHGGLVRFDMTPKPAYHRINELINHRWHTEEELVCSPDGVCRFRGFFGDYQLEIDCCQEVKKLTFSLSKGESNDFTFTL